MKKKLAAIALVIVMVAMLFTGLTIAYFTDTDSATNTFTVGDIEIELTEPNWKPDNGASAENGILDNIVPGVTYPKDPTVTNTGTNPAYVRVIVSFPGYEGSVWGNENDILPTAFLEGVNKEQFDIRVGSFGGNYAVIMESKAALASNEKLFAFTGVKLPAEVDETYLKNAYGKTEDAFKFEIVVTAQAIQSEGFKTAKEAFAALDAELS